MNMKGIKFLILTIIVVGALLVVNLFNLGEYLDSNRLRGWVDSFGTLGPIVYIAVYSISPAFMVPGLPITIAGALLFGPVWGVVYVTIGATIGSSVSFLIARYLGRSMAEDMVKRLVGDVKFNSLNERVVKGGWKVVAITRLIPLFPYNLLNYAYGLTNIPFGHYVTATFVFMIPGITAYVVFSSSILDVFKGQIPPELVIGAVLLLIVSLLPMVYKRYNKGGKGVRRNGGDEDDLDTP